MTENLIIGSGPSAAAVALSLLRSEDETITFLDVGEELEDGRRNAIDQLLSVSHWTAKDAANLGLVEQPKSSSGPLPEKRVFGSDYPFRDFGQLAERMTPDDSNTRVVSGAFGGFSNVWGAQVFPFLPEEFDDWPVSYTEMKSAYDAVLGAIPHAGQSDDLADYFPLYGKACSLPPLSERTERVLGKYERHRCRIRSEGIVMGRARLALEGDKCVRCGLCMTGCPLDLIFSARHLMTQLQRSPRVSVRRSVVVTRIIETNEDKVEILYRDSVAGGRLETIRADRAFLACGAIGSSRILANSIYCRDLTFELLESAQFVQPFVSARKISDLASGDNFTLNQFCALVRGPDPDDSPAFLHFYPYNPAYDSAVPLPLRRTRLNPAILSRVTAALGYLPGSASPQVYLTVRKPGQDSLPPIEISRAPVTQRTHRRLRGVVRQLSRVAPFLDLWPSPHPILAKGAKSYHFGGSFPMTNRRIIPGQMLSDRMGRPAGLKRVHMVDASVFSSVPATTFTLTIMANAYRIGSEVTRLA